MATASLEGLQALAFDAYGTLFSLEAVAEACEAVFPGQGEALARLWRAKQLEYATLLTLMERYEDFARVTERALDYCCRSLGLAPLPGVRSRLLESFLRLRPFVEVPAALDALRQRYRLAILSNGSPEMLRPLVQGAGLAGAFEALISAHEARAYKPSPRVYALGPQRLRLPKEAIGFVSSNPFDVAGAHHFGYPTLWVNRSGALPEELDAAPLLVVPDMASLADALLRD